MATSQSHTLGEFIGSFFEDLMKEPISAYAKKNNLYFDATGPRKARRGKKLTWTDTHGSKHDLDFVLEKDGNDETIGDPVAFIELAWRRYTKHSKNKVQEIEGAINPICERYKLIKPFKGAILAGQFTDTSIQQLKNDGFHVLYIPFDKLVQSFKKYGIDITFDEDTKESEIRKKIKDITKASTKTKIEKIKADILESCNKEIVQFISELNASFSRKIKSICVLPLHGLRTEVANIDNAIDYIIGYSKIPAKNKLEYIEVIVTYNNGTIIQCQFKEKNQAIEFLEKLK